MANPIVSVARNQDISIAVKEVLKNLTLPDLNNKKILLKPNCGREAQTRVAINTNPDVVSAIYEFLISKYPNAEYFIGDSPIISTDTIKAFELSGFNPLLEEPNLKFLDLDDKQPKEIPIPNGTILKSIRVTGYFEKFDYIISIPVLKMHMHTGATLSFKNMKGMIYKRDKVTLHHLQNKEALEEIKKQYGFDDQKIKELDIAIADLSYVIKPDLAIIDASYAMEGMGPSSGEKVKLDTIIGSTDFLAADIVALRIAKPEWTLRNVPHLKLIYERRLVQQNMNNFAIKTIPENLDKFVHPIKSSPKTISIQYDNVKLIDIESCSSCLSTVFAFVKNYKDFIDANFTAEKPLSLAIGKGINNTDLYEPTFLIGNCTANCRSKGIFIKGCTPVQSAIKKQIDEYLKNNKN